MPFRKHLLLPLLGLALLLGGCGPSVSYSYIPPTSDAGLHCVSQCNAEKRQCKTLAKLQQRQDEALYQAQSTAYNYCMQNSDKKKRKSCPYPQRNFDFGDDCQDEYRSCYQSCGGTIRRIVHQDWRDVRQASRTCGNTVRRRRSTCAPSPLPPRYHAGPAR